MPSQIARALAPTALSIVIGLSMAMGQGRPGPGSEPIHGSKSTASKPAASGTAPPAASGAPAATSPDSASSARPAAKTAGDEYHNIQVLKDIQAEQLIPAMNYMAASLGVRCNYCHVRPFEKDDKKEKATARKMITMMRAVNHDYFDGKLKVTCNTCHHGHGHPISTLQVAQLVAPPPPADAVVSMPADSLLPLDALLEHYVHAIGGRGAYQKVTTLRSKGTRETRATGRPAFSGPVEVVQQAPGKVYSTGTAPDGPSTVAFDGERGWTQSGREVRDMGPAEVAFAKVEANFYRPIELPRSYRRMSVIGKAKVAGRDAYVVRATTGTAASETGREQLFFDARSGLLVRRSSEQRTPLGALLEVHDYEDYRPVGGLVLPFTHRVARSFTIVTDSFTDIQVNAPVDPKLFERPAESH